MRRFKWLKVQQAWVRKAQEKRISGVEGAAKEHTM